MADSLRAGAASVDISPGPGIPLAGYPHFPRHNTGIHDPLMAACIVLDDGATRVAIVCMDTLFFSRRYVQKVRQNTESSTGIPAANILICCSHTHSSPWAPISLSWVCPAMLFIPMRIISPCFRIN